MLCSRVKLPASLFSMERIRTLSRPHGRPGVRSGKGSQYLSPGIIEKSFGSSERGWKPRKTHYRLLVNFAHTDSLVCDLNRTPIVMAKHGGSCGHFSGISTCGRTSPETVSHPQRQSLQTPCKISLAVYVIVTNKRLQPLTMFSARPA